MASDPIIPRYFVLFFTVIDTIAATIAVPALLFKPDNFLNSLTPGAKVPAGPDTSILMVTFAGVYACLIIIHQMVLKPRPDDLALWRSFETAQMLIELSKLASTFYQIYKGHGLSFMVFLGIGINIVGVLNRILFLCGLGVKKEKSS